MLRRQQVVRLRWRVRKGQRRLLHHSVHFAQRAGVLEQVFLPRRNAEGLANQVVHGSGDATQIVTGFRKVPSSRGMRAAARPLR